MDFQFIIEEHDYSMTDFIRKFHAHLPAVVKVNQGFQGHTNEDTYGKDEILFIAAMLKEKRVVARVDTGVGRFRVLSIPERYAENLCMVKNGHAGPETSLAHILQHHRLPFKVKIPPNYIIFREGKRFRSEQLPALDLQSTFEETYLVGNLLINGRLAKKIRIPLYLSQLRFCLVTGIKLLTGSGWKKHVQELKDESQNAGYNELFNSQNIAEYDVRDFRADTKIELREPVKCDTILNIMQLWPECQFMRSGYRQDNSLH